MFFFFNCDLAMYCYSAFKMSYNEHLMHIQLVNNDLEILT